MLDNPYVRIVNNFLHDLATGTWAACLLVLWVLSGRAAGIPPEAFDALASATQVLWWLLLAALGVVALTGALRLVYWRAQTSAEDAHAKRRALLVKHAAFALLYGIGTLWGWTLLP